LHHAAAVAILGAVLLTMASDQGTRAPGPPPGVSAVPVAEPLVSRWPVRPRALARLMIERYGKPDEVVASQVSWNRRGPWSKIVVFRDPDPSGRGEHLLQSVAYGPVSVNALRGLDALGRGATYDAAARELSARTDSEETNFLALNLADEVVRGRRSVADARDFYDAASHLSAAGKSSPYMRGLMFGPRPAAR
jgi:hypothetical protein